MKNPLKTILAPVTLVALALLGGSVSAQILSFSTTTTLMPLGGPASGNIEQREIGFTMGSTGYSLTSVVLPLAFGSSISSTSFTLTLYGYSSATNSGTSATPLTTTVFTNPTFVYDTTNQYFPTYTSYTFTPQAAATLTAGMTYWLVLTDTDNPGTTAPGPLYWRGYNAGTFSNAVATQINTAGIAAIGSGYDSTTDRTQMQSSGNTGDFAIYGTAVVPEPPAWALGILGAAFLVRRLRSRQAAESAR